MGYVGRGLQIRSAAAGRRLFPPNGKYWPCYGRRYRERIAPAMPLRSLLAALVLFTVAVPSLTAADGAASSQPAPASYILVGFAGGFERHDNPRHGPVQL